MKSFALSRFIEVSGYIAVFLAGVFLGIVSIDLYRTTPLDGGIATLVGSFLGAAITVFGSLWAARYQASAQERASTKFVGDAVRAVRDQVYILTKLVAIEAWDDNEQHGKKLSDQVLRVKEVVTLFERNAPFSAISNWEARLHLSRLEEMIKTDLAFLDKELGWLEKHKTKGVLDSARNGLSNVSDRMFAECVEACKELGVERPVPSEKEVEKSLGLL